MTKNRYRFMGLAFAYLSVALVVPSVTAFFLGRLSGPMAQVCLGAGFVVAVMAVISAGLGKMHADADAMGGEVVRMRPSLPRWGHYFSIIVFLVAVLSFVPGLQISNRAWAVVTVLVLVGTVKVFYDAQRQSALSGRAPVIRWPFLVMFGLFAVLLAIYFCYTYFVRKVPPSASATPPLFDMPSVGRHAGSSRARIPGKS